MTIAAFPPPSLIGVVGGLGPLASAEFVQAIYRRCPAGREQDMPQVVLLSDPTFPDRTRSLLDNDDAELRKRLCEALRELNRIGASDIVICCFTIHHLLGTVPPELRGRVVSLLDVVFTELAARARPHLLLCTTGTRRLGVFQRHPSWSDCEQWIVLPDEADQAAVHDLIYQLKVNRRPADVVPAINAVLDRYGVGGFIAGCTELHLVAAQYRHTTSLARDPGVATIRHECLDPLSILAGRYAGGGTP